MKPIVKTWAGMKIVKVSSVGDEFRRWLGGQTCPLVEDDPTPDDWAYYWDYERFRDHKPVVD